MPDGQDQVRLTLSAPPMTKKRVVNLALEGRATIDGQEIVRPVVPAENMMQAFIYWHLVPVNELSAIVSAGAGTNTTVRILDELPIQIPVGGTAAVRMRVPIGPRLPRLPCFSSVAYAVSGRSGRSQANRRTVITPTRAQSNTHANHEDPMGPGPFVRQLHPDPDFSDDNVASY